MYISSKENFLRRDFGLPPCSCPWCLNGNSAPRKKKKAKRNAFQDLDNANAWLQKKLDEEVRGRRGRGSSS